MRRRRAPKQFRSRRNFETQMVSSRVGPRTAKAVTYAEVKYLQRFNTGELAADNTNGVDLCQIPIGQTQFQRIGNQVKLLQLKLNFVVHLGSAATATTVYTWRLTVFQWRPMSDQNPDASIIWDQNIIDNNAFSMYNVNRKPNFKIMYDETGFLNGSGGTAFPIGQACTAMNRVTLNIPTKVLSYPGTNAVPSVATTIGPDHVYYLFQSGTTKGEGSALPTLSIGTKLTYIDS